MTRSLRTVILPADALPPCLCGEGKVHVFRDGLEDLLDNMGCELGLEMIAGPLCPRCEAGKLEEARREG
jgi:hypothetical protein